MAEIELLNDYGKPLTEEDLIAPAFRQAFNDFLDCKYSIQVFSGGRGCIAKGTRIATPRGNIPVEKFQGGLVYAFDGRRIVEAEACRPILYDEEDLYTLTTSAGRTIIVTAQHRFLTPRGWKTAADLAAEETIFVSDAPRITTGEQTRSAAVRFSASILNLLYRYWQDFAAPDALRLPPKHDDETTYADVLASLSASNIKRDGLPSAALADWKNRTRSRISACQSLEAELSRTVAGYIASKKFTELLRSFSRALINAPSIRDIDDAVRSFASDLLAFFSEDAKTLPNAGYAVVANTILDLLWTPVSAQNASTADDPSAEELSAAADICRTDTVASVRFSRRERYYDLFVPSYHNYFADGFLNHNSTKSTFIALCVLFGLHLYPRAHAICYRKVAATLEGSVFNTFQKVINEYIPGTEIARNWVFKKSPLRMVNTKTGQTIVFKGLDDPLKSKSISPPFGTFRFLVMEELAEYDGYEEIRSVRQSVLRGKGPFQSFYAYNPPETASAWVNFEIARQAAIDRTLHWYHSTFKSVPVAWLGEDFFREAINLARTNPRAYRHEYLGEVTGTGGTIFPNVVLRQITDAERARFSNIHWGCDFGSVDPTVLIGLEYQPALRRILIFTEVYQSMMLLDEMERQFKEHYFGTEFIMADSACTQMIMELENRGLNMLGAKKGPDSILHGIKWLQNLVQIVIDPIACPNAAREFAHYEYLRLPDGSFKIGFPDKDNHTIDSCVTGDTLVHTLDGKVRISELVGRENVGVYTYNAETDSIETSTMTHCWLARKDAELVRLILTDGTMLTCTPDHKILVRGKGYVKAEELAVGEKVVVRDGTESADASVWSVQKMKSRQDVFDMEVLKHHNFIADKGIVIHNCRYATEDLATGAGLL